MQPLSDGFEIVQLDDLDSDTAVFDPDTRG